MTVSPRLKALQQQLSETFGLEVSAFDYEQLSKELAVIINHLILNDMNRLWFILYRVDIAEEFVLKTMAENTISTAAKILADALIIRQLQKIESRKNSRSSPDIPENEKW